MSKFRLTEEFINQYKGKQPEWSPIGYIVYKRTYSRDIELETGGTRLEEWWETCRRVVEGTFELQRRHIAYLNTPWNAWKAQKSAQEMYRLMWDFKFLPPGRGLYNMGSPMVMDKGNGSVLFNCAFSSTKEIDSDFVEPFAFTFEASAHQIGVGFDTAGEGKVEIVIPKVSDQTYVVEDTREGWSDLLKKTLSAYIGVGALPKHIDYSKVRPKGSPIKTMGGTASGPEALQELIEKDIPKIMTPGKLTSSQIVDLMNVIGKCVVSGAQRRSAEIALARIDDADFRDLKLDTEKLNDWRWASNNSHFCPPDFRGFEEFVDPIFKRGEPGFIFLDNCRKYGRIRGEDSNYRDSEVAGTNPCAEQTLENGEVCNICETFPARCADLEEFKRAIKYAYLYAKTVTLTTTPWPKTNAIMLRNRRIGLSMTGIIQSINRLGFAEHIRWCEEGYKYINELDVIYSRWLCTPYSIKKTTVKPSGCQRKDTLITTTKGIFMLEEMGDCGGQVWQDINYHTSRGEDITKFFVNGKVPTKIFHTEDGNELECSFDHKYQIFDNGEILWKSASDLKVGDILTCELNNYNNTKNAVLKCVEAPYCNVAPITQPSVMTPDLAWLIGLVFGDGSVHNRGLRISFNRKESSLVLKIKEIVNYLFGIEVCIDNDHSIYINSTWLLKYLSENNLLKSFSEDMAIPLAIRTSSREVILSFITGLWRADGGLHNNATWSVCTVSKKMALQLFTVGRSVGLNLKIKNGGPGGWGSLDRWIITCRSSDPHDQKRWGKKLRSRQFGNLWFDPIQRIWDSENETYDLSVPSTHEYIANSVVSHNTISKLPGPYPQNSGIHYPKSEYYIQNIRFNKGSKILEVLENTGYPVEDDVYNKGTRVVSFPIKEGFYFHKTEADVSIWEQLENAAQMQEHWSDNSVSITVGLKEHERKDLVPALERYQSRLKSVSFLPEGHDYKQAPWIPITKEQYEEMSSKILKVDLAEALSNAEHEVTEKFCDSDICQI